ncbi:HNH nuclease [Vibrio phage 1.262.O._10N.286.51.A9]|nr:HNH nuclease [Vibrio phage 1.262.O._10N.286.51.A9]
MDRPLCGCGNLCKKRGKPNKHGIQYYRKHCGSCERKLYNMPRKYYRGFKEDKCIICGFIPKHICQLDVDHIDGNHNNNSPENLQTLCANCHRLKTQLNRDWQ